MIDDRDELCVRALLPGQAPAHRLGNCVQYGRLNGRITHQLHDVLEEIRPFEASYGADRKSAKRRRLETGQDRFDSLRSHSTLVFRLNDRGSRHSDCLTVQP